MFHRLQSLRRTISSRSVVVALTDLPFVELSPVTLYTRSDCLQPTTFMDENVHCCTLHSADIRFGVVACPQCPLNQLKKKEEILAFASVPSTATKKGQSEETKRLSIVRVNWSECIIKVCTVHFHCTSIVTISFSMLILSSHRIHRTSDDFVSNSKCRIGVWYDFWWTRTMHKTTRCNWQLAMHCTGVTTRHRQCLSFDSINGAKCHFSHYFYWQNGSQLLFWSTIITRGDVHLE